MADQTSGSAVPLSYGYNWRTGIKLQSRTLENTGNQNLDYTRVGMYLLGEGQEDGLVELWDAGLGRLLLQNESDNTNIFHWHSGCDAVAGSGSFPSSIGTDQGVDSFWQYLAPGLQPLHYHRWSYYAFAIKQLINNPPNTNQNDPSVWADVNPIGLWRCLRCRIFDENGAMTGYAFTRNPVWHYVDLLLRRKLFQEYSIDFAGGADDLTTAVRARFLWPVLAESAADCDAVLTNGRPRFSGDYSFSQKTTLQACLSQVFAACRGRNLERAGKYAIIVDKPRASVFTFSRANADSFVVTDADVHTAPNNYVAKFRDLEIPAFGAIVSIQHVDNQDVLVTMDRNHPVTADDYVVLGGTGTNYDGYWQVRASTGDTTFTLINRGNNYPASVGAVGSAGLRFSRFKDRAPEFRHVALQLVRGAVGVGIPRMRNKTPETTDFGNSTWDQAARVSAYQRAVQIGPDVAPYVAPPRGTLQARSLFAPDAAGSGAVAVQLEPGDVVAVADDLSYAYAGLWEIMSGRLSFMGSNAAQASQRTPAAGGYELQLRPYSDGNYPDSAPGGEPGWPTVPGIPGGTIIPTYIPLADGEAAFYVGSGADLDSFPLPDGYTLQNCIAWASPQGYIEHDGQMHTISDCDAYTDRILRMVYTDTGAKTWRGDVNYAVIAWRTRNSATVTYTGAMQYVELTLAGGEKMIFGKGIIFDGQPSGLPSGYVAEFTRAIAFPKTAPIETSNVAHGVAAWVLADGRVMCRYQDGEAHVWGGSAAAFIVSFKNNLNTWKTRSDGWAYCPLAGGKTLAIGAWSIYSGTQPTFYGEPGYGPPMNMQVVGDRVPALTQMPSTSLQAMTGPDGFDIVDHPAHGLRDCSVHSDGTVVCTFEDGEGNVWGGSSGVFALLCDVATGDLAGTTPPAGGTVWAGVSGGGGLVDGDPGDSPTADAGGPYNSTTGVALTFDGSASTAPLGEALTYAWDFGDSSTGTGVSPTHSYAAAGTYTVTLTVTNPNGMTAAATSTATIIALPVANAGGPYNGHTGTPITFSGAGSSDPNSEALTYSWTMGDGAQLTGVSPAHAYAAAGTYTVTLTVTNTDGQTATATTTASIVPPPTAHAGGPYSGHAGAAISFSGAGSSDPRNGALTYSWTLGDGSTATGVSPTHTYAAAGTYTATLTVATADGATGTATATVTVS